MFKKFKVGRTLMKLIKAKVRWINFSQEVKKLIVNETY